MIFGVGIDIIEVARVGRLIEKDKGFKERVYAPGEIDYCEAKKNKAQNYAARFAAKEAFMKALGTGWRGGLAFHQIEVVNNEWGKPEIVLHGQAKLLVEKEGITNINISISHIKDFASSIVTIEK